MKITVKLFASLRDGRFEKRICDYPAGVTIKTILRDIHIQDKEVVIIIINNVHAKPDQELHNDDIVAVFPLVGGG